MPYKRSPRVVFGAVVLLSAWSGGGGIVLAQNPAAQVRREEWAWPSGDRASSSVLVERMTPLDVRRGAEFFYEIRVTNLTRRALDGLTVTERIPVGFQLRSTNPEPTRRDGSVLSWTIRDMTPQVAYALRVSGVTDQPQELNWCAMLSLDTPICSSTRVVEPRLALTKSMPAEVLICEEIPIRMTVSNTGSGIARNVQVNDTLPVGLILPDGKNAMLFNVGDLPAGQARELVAAVRATRPGQYRNPATAREEGGPPIEAVATTVVREPKLVVSKSGPNRRYVGRNATFDIMVQNVGDGPARDTVLTDAIPPGVELVGTLDGRGSGGVVSWTLGTLAPGAAKSVQLTVRPTQIGRLTNTATARALCTEASASAVLDVEGIPAILLEVVDVDDPVEVGGQVRYEIVVVNQGSATGTNIELECTLPPQQQFVSAVGATQGVATGNAIRYAPLPTLAPKMQARYVVTAKALQPGDVRFRVSMRSAEIDSPVEETEATRLYE